MIRILILISTALILLLLPLRPAALAQIASGDILFIDDFSSGSLGSWIIETGNWHIQDGRLVGSGYGRALGGRTGTGNTEWDNYIYEIDVLNKNGIDEGIGFRRSPDGGTNSYEVIIRHGTGNYNTPEIILAKVEEGQLHILYDTHDIPLVNNQTYRFKFLAEDEHLQGWVNDTLIYDIVDSGTKVKKGPISLSYNSGDFGVAEVYFDNVKVTNLNPTPSITPSPSVAPTPTAKIPLIFIPGIAGSELKVTQDINWSQDNGHGGIYTNEYKKDEKVWVNELEAIKPGNDDYFDILRLNADGKTDLGNIIPNGEAVGRAYQPTINFFVNQGYTLNQDMFVFGYDWRKDLAETTGELDDRIKEIKQKTSSSKVNLVTHSMGGLLGRNYINSPQKAENINKLIALAPPYLGSVKMAKSLVYGDCINPLPISTEPLCLGINGQEVMDLLQNYPTAYQLLPTQKYYTFYDGSNNVIPTPFRDDRDIDGNLITGSLTYDQTKQLLTNLSYNTQLYSLAENFHQINNNLQDTKGVDMTIIAGTGEATIGQIIEKNKFDFAGIKIPTTDLAMINGDGTVPLFSASLNDHLRSISMFDPQKVFYVKDTHGGIANDPKVLNFAKSILDGNPVIPQEISNNPYKLTGGVYSVHSPVEINAYDAAGNHTGTTVNGEFEEKIPGSKYEIINDSKFIFLPSSGIYQIKFTATDQGKFDFKIRNYENDQNTTTKVYKDIPLTKETTGQIFIDNNSNTSPTLLIDSNGDETNDKQFIATEISGNATQDSTAPKTNISIEGTKGTNNWYSSDTKIVLTSTDEPNGSGISKVEYSIDNGHTVQTYSQPFSITKEGINTLRVKSTDKAGNEESLQEIMIMIDKTPPEVKIIFNLTNQDFQFMGKDDSSKTIVKDSGEIITITDEAENITKLILSSKDRPRRENIKLKSIQYNNQKVIKLDENLIGIFYTLNRKNEITFLLQRAVIKGEERIYSLYNPLNDTTEILIKKPKSKIVTQKVAGKRLLYLETQKGELNTGY